MMFSILLLQKCTLKTSSFAGISLMLLLLFPVVVQSQGRIAGTITDAATGEPLPGAQVIIMGTSTGAAADIDGNYNILNVPPGEYNLRFTMIGFKNVVMEGVQVQTDLTTRVNQQLTEAVGELDEVVVTAQRAIVQRDLTHSQQSFSAMEIESAPIESISEIIEMQAGINIVEPLERPSVVEDMPGDGLHIRGGRENETVFLVDGIRVDNPMWGGSAFAQNISGSSINEVNTQLGTFNAEYGGRMSGIVGLSIRDGDEDKYDIQLRGFTDRVGISSISRNTMQGELILSGPVPFVPNLTFFTNLQGRTTDGRHRGYIVENWTDLKGQVPIRDEDGNELGTPVAADWTDEWHTYSKLTWRPFSGFRVSASYFRSQSKEKRYRHRYRYLPYSMPWTDTMSDALSLRVTHFLSNNTYYELYGSAQRHDFWRGIHKIREQRIAIGSSGSDDIHGFSYAGADNDYWADTTSIYQGGFKITSQISQINQIRSGFEIRSMDMFHRRDVAWTDPIREEIFIDDQGLEQTRIWHNHKSYASGNPVEMSGFVQNKMEFTDIGLIINMGLRWENWNINQPHLRDPYDPFETDLVPTQSKNRISPRLGISYPISERAAFHFAYGHFYQFPSYYQMLTGINERGRYPDRPNLEDIGIAIFNPDINPERSVTYEAGVQTEIMNNLGLRITTYYRSLSDLIGVRVIESAVGGYVFYDNVDFGNSQGMELVINKRPSRFFSARVNYTLSRSLISSASPVTASQRVGSPLAYQTVLADWDRTHDLTGLFVFYLPADSCISFNTRIRSGRPYTVMAERPNTERSPTYYNTNVRLNKRFNYFGGRQTLFIQVYNIFNRRNIYAVYTGTGKWDDDGDAGTTYAMTANPRRISDGTRVRIGLRLRF
jgi:hypothetical protein